MKRIVFAVAMMVMPVYANAKDAGPATKPAAKVASKKETSASAPVTKPAVAKVASKKEASASQPASMPDKSEVKIEGRVEIPDKKDVKITPTPESGVGDMIYGIYTNFKSGNVWNGIALLLMLVTFVIGLLKKNIPPKYLPWIAAGIGVATNIASAIIGGVDWAKAVTVGLFQGAAAAGLWSMVGKYILRGKEQRMKRARAREWVDEAVASGSIKEK